MHIYNALDTYNTLPIKSRKTIFASSSKQYRYLKITAPSKGEIVLSYMPSTGVGTAKITLCDAKKKAIKSTSSYTSLATSSGTNFTDEQNATLALSSFGFNKTGGSSFLMFGDHNINTSFQGAELRVWSTFPTSSSSTATKCISTDTTYGGTVLPDNRIVLFGHGYLYIYKNISSVISDIKNPTLKIGRGAPDGPTNNGYYFNGGDANSVIYAGGKLYASCYNGNKIVGYSSIPTTSNALPNIVIGDTNSEAYMRLPSETGTFRLEKRRFNNAADAYIDSTGKLIVSEMNYNQVFIWNSISDAISGKTPTILGSPSTNYTMKDLNQAGPDFITIASKNSLFMPRRLAFDGKNLWIGEFKFSSRLLLFQPTN